MTSNASLCAVGPFNRLFQGELYPEDEVEDFIDSGRLFPTWWTLGEDGAEDSGVDISSMSAYGPDCLEPFLLKALLKELRNCTRKRRVAEINDRKSTAECNSTDKQWCELHL